MERIPRGVPAGGQFSMSVRGESLQSLSAATEPGLDRQWVDEHGACPNCGHVQEPHKTDEVCDPSCPECGGQMENPDIGLCDYCQERADEDASWDEEGDFDD
ncbi:hypothetical protein [Nocardioides pakistanensis]